MPLTRDDFVPIGLGKRARLSYYFGETGGDDDMKLIALSAVALLVAAPVSARSRVVKHPSRGAMYGTPIIAGSSAVRVSPDGLVISDPVPVIQKEKDFNASLKRGGAPVKTNGVGQP